MTVADHEEIGEDAIQTSRRQMANDPGSAADDLARLASIYAESGNKQAALEARRYQCFARIMNLEIEEADRVALVFLKEANDFGQPRFIGLAQMYLGIISLETGEMGLACEFLEEALITAMESQDPDLISRVQMNLGNAFFNFERYEDAIRSFQSGLENLECGGGVSSISLGEYNLASGYTMLAHKHFREGISYEDEVESARVHIAASLVRPEVEESTKLFCQLLSTHLDTLTMKRLDAERLDAIAAQADLLDIEPLRVAVLETTCYCCEAIEAWEMLYGVARRAIKAVRQNGGIKTIDRLLTFAARGAAGIQEFEQAYEFIDEALKRSQSMSASQESRRAHVLDAKLQVQKAKFDQQVLRMRNQFLVERNKELEVEVKLDRLSGVLNRRGVEETLHELVKKRPGTFAVALIDIDFFKRVNDTYGHGVGDDVIRTFAGILSSSQVELLAVGRWGGEEFLIAFETKSNKDTAVVAESIIQDIRSFNWEFVQPGLKVTASLGVAFHDPYQHIDEAVKTADAFLYAAKQAGRDCWMYRARREAA